MFSSRLSGGLLVAAAGLPCAAQPVPTVTEFNLPNGNGSAATCISGDGKVVGGYAYPQNSANPRPVRWTRQNGLQQLGVLSGGNRAEVHGLRIAQNFPIPGGPPCYANFDGSTAAPILNVSDFGCFLNKFAAQDP